MLASAAVQGAPLAGSLVVDLTRYLPGPFASRELLRLGARVVRLESPAGDPLREIEPAWDTLLNAGKESVVCDLKAEPELGRALCARADVVLESFRPGVAARLGVGPDDLPERVVYCSLTGFEAEGDRAPWVGHDLNYLGYAGALADTAPALPPLPVADLGGALSAVGEILAALLERERTGRGARLTVSLTAVAQRLAPFGGPLTGRLACYRIYRTGDGRWLTVAALEPSFFTRLCELVGRPELAAHQADADQESLAAELEESFAARPLAAWLELLEGEEACAGPVLSLEEATAGSPPAPAPALGEHTEAWRRELQPGRGSPSAAGSA